MAEVKEAVKKPKKEKKKSKYDWVQPANFNPSEVVRYKNPEKDKLYQQNNQTHGHRMYASDDIDYGDGPSQNVVTFMHREVINQVEIVPSWHA